ncbi:MAG: hotdog domain-containing protein, partial [candidate division WOR-3 bacterium]|nr:hotdog domain-containing protein [candidate division WOR-3 bacterium]
WAAAGRDIVTVTAEINVRFRNPLPTDHTITLEGKVTEERKRLIIAQAKAFDDERVYAEAQGKLFRIP